MSHNSFCKFSAFAVFVLFFLFVNFSPKVASAQLGGFANRPQLPSVTISECDFCLCSEGISPLEMGKTGIRYDVRYLKMDHQYQDGHFVPNGASEAETYLTNTLTFNYQALPNFSVSFALPYTSRQMTPVAGLSDEAPIANSGIGDISL